MLTLLNEEGVRTQDEFSGQQRSNLGHRGGGGRGERQQSEPEQHQEVGDSVFAEKPLRTKSNHLEGDEHRHLRRKLVVTPDGRHSER